jgi:hypothetical protein
VRHPPKAREGIDKKMEAWDKRFPASAGRAMVFGSVWGAIKGAVLAPPGAEPEGAIIGAAKGGSWAVARNAVMITAGRPLYEGLLSTKATLQCLASVGTTK